jgi:phosphoribosylformylglycinamidine synthase
MTSYEIMLSESQERMLLVATKGREDEVLNVFKKWGLDGVIVGAVHAEERMRIRHHGVLVADIPNRSLTDEAPLYHRPIGTWKAPVALEPSEDILGKLAEDRDFTADLKKLLASANVCNKRWVHEQYDSMVQTNTVLGPGGEAGVMRIKGTGALGHERGLAMTLDGNGRWAYLNPKLGAMHATAEAARKVASTGATPVAATNCLNFGNPEKPEIMAQLSAAIDGISEACTALGTPITGGNVSLYNETLGEGIYPTPVLGIVGIIDDVSKAVPAHFQEGGDAILLMWPIPAGEEPNPDLHVPIHPERSESNADPLAPALGGTTLLHPEETGEAETLVAPELIAFGSSEYANVVLGGIWGQPPPLDLDAEADLHTLLEVLAERELLRSARDISDGGIAVALAQAAFPLGVGAKVEQEQSLMVHPLFGLFAEPASTMLVSTHPSQISAIEELAANYNYFVARIGSTGGDRLEISVYHEPFISAPLEDLSKPWASALEATLHGEVTA